MGGERQEKSLAFMHPKWKASNYSFHQTTLTISYFFFFLAAYLKISTWQTFGKMRTHMALTYFSDGDLHPDSGR